ncbi:MAG: hypothetical protein RIF41_07795 [Polyangiaceae bacterium]
MALIARAAVADIDKLAEQILAGGPLTIRRAARLLEIIDAVPPAGADDEAAGGES